jgi:predicted PurR-regulated permease PerM
MQTDDTLSPALRSQLFMDVMIRIGLIGLLAWMCFRVFFPFLGMMLWALILAIGMYPLQQRLVARLGGRPARATSLLVVALVLLIGVPFVMLSTSFASHIQETYTAFEQGTLTISRPNESVAEWPLVGERVHAAWSEAADNLPQFVEDNKVMLEEFARRGFAMAASSATTTLVFLAALVIAGIIMAYGEQGSTAMQRIFCRLAGPSRGQQLQQLSTATVRSVASGVIGVAMIQALLLGVGFFLAGIPAAGVLALIVMVLGIAQLPATLVSLPAIAYLWSSGDFSTTHNAIFTVVLLVAGLADNVLKPMLLGRGVDAPMPVILIGALGGMVTTGVIGLFVGAVVLAVGYRLFMEWVDQTPEESPTQRHETAGSVAPTEQ